MGAASLIATAVGIFLIVLAAYVLVGGIVTSAEMVSAAQKTLSEREAARIHTVVEIINGTVVSTSRLAFIEVKNTGSETITDIDDMEVYLMQDSAPVFYSNVSGDWTCTIRPDRINPKILDPDEVMNISVTYIGPDPAWAKVVTPNGVYDSAYL